MGITMKKPSTGNSRVGVRARIRQILSDCKHHSRAELIATLWDELSDKVCVRVHVHYIRKGLPKGWRLIYEFVNEVHGYRLIPPPDESITPS